MPYLQPFPLIQGLKLAPEVARNKSLWRGHNLFSEEFQFRIFLL